MKMVALVPILVVFGMLSLSVSIWLSRCSICSRRQRTSNNSENNGDTGGDGSEGGRDNNSDSGTNNRYASKLVNYCLCAKQRWRQQRKKKQLEYLPPFLADICQVDSKVPFGSISSLPSLPPPPPEMYVQQQQSIVAVGDAGSVGCSCVGGVITGRKRRRSSLAAILKDCQDDCERLCGGEGEGEYGGSSNAKICCANNQGEKILGQDNLAFESDIVTVSSNYCKTNITSSSSASSSSAPSTLSNETPSPTDESR